MPHVSPAALPSPVLASPNSDPPPQPTRSQLCFLQRRCHRNLPPPLLPWKHHIVNIKKSHHHGHQQHQIITDINNITFQQHQQHQHHIIALQHHQQHHIVNINNIKSSSTSRTSNIQPHQQYQQHQHHIIALRHHQEHHIIHIIHIINNISSPSTSRASHQTIHLRFATLSNVPLASAKIVFLTHNAPSPVPHAGSGGNSSNQTHNEMVLGYASDLHACNHGHTE